MAVKRKKLTPGHEYAMVVNNKVNALQRELNTLEANINNRLRQHVTMLYDHANRTEAAFGRIGVLEKRLDTLMDAPAPAVPKKMKTVSGWVNMYKSPCEPMGLAPGGAIYPTKQKALDTSGHNCVATVLLNIEVPA